MTAGAAYERAARWERTRLRHDEALRAAGMVPIRAARRLRYACLTPAGPLVRAAAVLVVLGYAGWTAVRGEFDGTFWRVAGFVALLVVLATNRASVTEVGLSFDVAGFRRLASFGFVPLYAVRAVVTGRRPPDWPRGPWHGGAWFGRRRVHLRYEDRHGDERVRSAWVKDPRRYAETVLGGRPEPRSRQRRKPKRRR